MYYRSAEKVNYTAKQIHGKRLVAILAGQRADGTEQVAGIESRDRDQTEEETIVEKMCFMFEWGSL